MLLRFVICLATVATLPFGSTSVLAQEISFGRDIAPILASQCYECHGPDEQQREAGLRLDVEAGAIAELDSGTSAITPGDTANSELLKRITSTGDDRMPPAEFGERISPLQIKLLSQWIEAGAKWEGHWAFRPLDARRAPAISDRSQIANAIDQFVVGRLSTAGLQPAPEADRYTLIRRLYFDVLGVPPSPDTIQAFVADQQPDAWSRLVDSLLAAPQYGERWGRHWLDVARYGDSNGGDENHAYPLAHRYRDYVIEAMNDDLPYDRFVEQQLAGDTMPMSGDERSDAMQLTATGYLAIGMKILAEQDPVKKRADMVDEQIDTVGRTFLGMSLGCARCHDHKFDPIPTRDYYALAGIFHSSNVADKPLPSREFETQLTSYRDTIDSLEASLQAAERKVAPSQSKEHADSQPTAITREAESFDRGNVVIDNDNYGKGIGIISDPGGQENFAEYDIALEEATRYVVQLRYAALKARPGKLLINGETASDKAIDQATGGWNPEHQSWQTEGIFEFKSGKNTLRIESQPMMSHVDKIRLLRADSIDTDAIKRVDELTTRLTTLRQAEPKPTMVMAISDGEVQNTKLHRRGSHLDLGEEVGRGFLEVLDGAQPTVPSDSSGRKHLARWLTKNDTAAALTSRVIVNRLWHWHFGRGLVTTPDEFGVRGQPPTHPQLLDYLARELIRNDWSLKKLHRQILLSHTYRMTTTHKDPHATKVDPSNRLLWKRDRLRLNAESIRDAMLVHSQELINETGNAPMNVKSQDPSPEDMARNLAKYESSPRRSVYLPVVRSNVYEFLTLFDFPNASTPVGKRNETTIPTQALWMMNSPFVAARAERIASQAQQSTPRGNGDTTTREKIATVYLKLFGRPANETEIARGEKFIHAQADHGEAWTAYVQVLLGSNDYLYVR